MFKDGFSIIFFIVTTISKNLTMVYSISGELYDAIPVMI